VKKQKEKKMDVQSECMSDWQVGRERQLSCLKEGRKRHEVQKNRGMREN